MSQVCNFKPGDKVIRDGRRIGIIKRITPTRKNIVVDYGSFEEKYTSSGICHLDQWHYSSIEKWTPEEQKKIDDRQTIKKCQSLFEKHKYNLSAEEAKAIIDILQK